MRRKPPKPGTCSAGPAPSLPQRALECGSLLPLCSADLQVGTSLLSHPGDPAMRGQRHGGARASSTPKSGSKLPHSKARKLIADR